MNFPQLIRSSLFAALLGGAASTAFGAAAVAVGDDNYTYTVTNAASLDEAKAEALEECGKRVNNCKILTSRTVPGAIALAKGDDGMFSATDDTPEKARARAMADCRKNYKNCRFTALYWESGGSWGAWAHAMDEKGLLVATQFSYNFGNEADARADALDECAKQQKGKPVRCEVKTHFGEWGYAVAESASYASVRMEASMEAAVAAAMANCKEGAKPGETCKLTVKAFNRGMSNAPASFDKLAAQTEVARKAKAPARQVATRAVQALSCTNRCVNGSCVRTFADGRTEKWQAPRVFDPFTNDWKWNTSSCGG